jgi:hypothetical protein
MFHISTTILTGSPAQISITNIPATYTHLQVRVFGRSADTGTAARQIYVNFNGDGSSNYSGHYFIGDGSNPSSGSALSTMYGAVGTLPASGSNSAIYGVSIIDILDYTNTNKNKTLKGLSGVDLNGAGMIGLNSGSWRNTAALTSIQLITEGNFAVGSRIDLYGLTTSQVTGA